MAFESTSQPVPGDRASVDREWPVEPPPARWRFDDWSQAASGHDVVGVGADLVPGTLLAAYRNGLFPMPSAPPRRPRHQDRGESAPPAWFCPVRRGVLPLTGLRVSRSLRRSCVRFEIRVNASFAEVIDACADPRRAHGWIDRDIRAAYLRLHELGWAHSVETWRDGRLVGAVYGVAIGGLFAGESMFYRETDASKAALVGLVRLLGDEHAGRRLIDVQWRTPHLASLGVVEIPRADYLARLPALLRVPLPRSLLEPTSPPSRRPTSGAQPD
ncbi:MAG: leucyl/phenylalanyl-tRNA--protein transferase [Nocardioides sp.]